MIFNFTYSSTQNNEICLDYNEIFVCNIDNISYDNTTYSNLRNLNAALFLSYANKNHLQIDDMFKFILPKDITININNKTTVNKIIETVFIYSSPFVYAHNKENPINISKNINLDIHFNKFTNSKYFSYNISILYPGMLFNKDINIYGPKYHNILINNYINMDIVKYKHIYINKNVLVDKVKSYGNILEDVFYFISKDKKEHIILSKYYNNLTTHNHCVNYSINNILLMPIIPNINNSLYYFLNSEKVQKVIYNDNKFVRSKDVYLDTNNELLSIIGNPPNVLINNNLLGLVDQETKLYCNRNITIIDYGKQLLYNYVVTQIHNNDTKLLFNIDNHHIIHNEDTINKNVDIPYLGFNNSNIYTGDLTKINYSNNYIKTFKNLFVTHQYSNINNKETYVCINQTNIDLKFIKEKFLHKDESLTSFFDNILNVIEDSNSINNLTNSNIIFVSHETLDTFINNNKSISFNNSNIDFINSLFVSTINSPILISDDTSLSINRFPTFIIDSKFLEIDSNKIATINGTSFLSTYSLNTLINKNIFTSTQDLSMSINKSTSIGVNSKSISIIKSVSVGLDSRSISIIKGIFISQDSNSALIHTGIFLNHNAEIMDINKNLFVNNNGVNAVINKNIPINNNEVVIFLNNNMFLGFSPFNIFVHKDINVNEGNQSININTNLFIKFDSNPIKLIKLLFISQDSISTILSKEMQIEYASSLPFNVNNSAKLIAHAVKNADVADVVQLETYSTPIFFHEPCVLNEQAMKIYIDKHNNLLSLVGKKLMTFHKLEWLDDGTWWNGYLDSPGNIDELLLPKIDFDYTSYKKIIFDTTLNTPRQYLKKLDDTTYIIKYPISHPLPEGGELAIDYLDLEVSILTHLIGITHTMWQKKIYEFGAMDMRNAVAAMIGYLKDYVDLVMPVQYHEQCYRVIRLFRWYGESVILKNSEYQVTLSYDQWKSNLNNSKMDIPYTLTNLHIDTTKCVITNNIINIPSSLVMDVSNAIDTTLSFQYALSGGIVEVYINDILLTSTEKTSGILEYELIAVENADVNKLKIVYNYGGTISIGNIIINDYTIGDMKMTYNPKIGTGNSIMNELLKTLVVVTDVADNNSVYMQGIINGNYAITEIIANLEHYFDIHHRNKQKGKRITIKK